MFDRTPASTCRFLGEEEEPMGRWIAVDLHPGSLFVLCQDEAGQELWHRRFPGGRQGEAELLPRLEPGDRVVLEATFGAQRLASRLESRGANVTVADPQQARLVGMRGKKSDYRDCRALLQHLRSGSLTAVWRPDAETRAIRQLTRERQAYNQSIVALKNRVRALLWEEGLLVPDDLWTEAGQAWLAEQELPPVVRQIVEREGRALVELTALKAAQEAALAAHALVRSEAVARLLQVPGFGMSTAVMLLGEVGELDRFPSAKHLVSYAGLNPRVHQSGGHCRTGPISKAGRSALRWLLVEVAWAHVRANGPEAARFQRLVKQGKSEGQAIVAVARQLLVLAYLLLTREAAYRQVPLKGYERKLQRLAAERPYAERQSTNVDWAAAQLEAVTGQPSPYRQERPAGPAERHRPVPRRRSRSGAATAVGAGSDGA
jgi:transposase